MISTVDPSAPLVQTEEETPRDSFSSKTTLILLLLITCTFGVGGTLCLVYTNNQWDEMRVVDWVGLFISTVPLIGIEITLGIPKAQESIRTYLCKEMNPAQGVIPVSTVITVCYIISGIVYKRFNPLIVIYVFFTCVCSMGSMIMVKQIKGSSTLTFVDGAVWLWLWVMLDLRWIYVYYWNGISFMGYDWWALTLTLLVLFSWGIFRNLKDMGYCLIPTIKDVLWGVGVLLPFMAIVIPLGLAVGFLNWPPNHTPTFQDVFTLWAENVLTVAITEELFFRAVLCNAIDQLCPSKYGWIALVSSSVMFGLMHIPRESLIGDQASYASFAFVAGLCYGSAYRFSGNHIAASVISHSITDTVWAFVF